MAVIDWNGSDNGGPFSADATIDLSDALTAGGLFFVYYAIKVASTGLGTLNATFHWTDSDGVARTFPVSAILLPMSTGKAEGSFVMPKQSVADNANAVFSLEFARTLSGGTWNASFKVL